MMLHTKHQSYWPGGFRQKDFSCFPYISHCKTCDPWGGAILTPGAMTKFSIGLQDDATYQISKL